MVTKSNKTINVAFVGLGADENPPATALYRYAPKKRAFEKVARVDGGRLPGDPDELEGVDVAVGPDVDDVKRLDPATLLRYRGDQVLEDWLRRGILHPGRPLELCCERSSASAGGCASAVRGGTIWWSHRITRRGARRPSSASSAAPADAGRRPVDANYPSALPLPAAVRRHRRSVRARLLLPPHHLRRSARSPARGARADPDRDRLSGPAEPIPARSRDRIGRGRAPPPRRPGPRARAAGGSGRCTRQGATREHHRLRARLPGLSGVAPAAAARREAYVLARPYLTAYICSCAIRKVGQAFIAPGGTFDFCYWRPRRPVSHSHCFTTFAYRVKQQIGGVWVTVYDGVAGHDYFAQGEEADLHTSNSQARPCGDGPEPPDPGEGLPFVMLEHVTGAGTHHFNFPVQSALSQVGALAVNSGLYDFGGVPDCPWASGLGLRLWVSPSLEGTVVYYRFKVVAVNAAGAAVGTPDILDAPVAWSRFVTVPGDVVTTSTGLAANPADVGGQEGLFTVPYWSGGMNWLSGQYHQTWNTTDQADGNYLLVLELFGPGGARIKPNGAPAGDPGAAEEPSSSAAGKRQATPPTCHSPIAHMSSGSTTRRRRRHRRPQEEPRCQHRRVPVHVGTRGTTTFSAGFRAYQWMGDDGRRTGRHQLVHARLFAHVAARTERAFRHGRGRHGRQGRTGGRGVERARLLLSARPVPQPAPRTTAYPGADAVHLLDPPARRRQAPQWRVVHRCIRLQ